MHSTSKIKVGGVWRNLLVVQADTPKDYAGQTAATA